MPPKEKKTKEQIAASAAAGARAKKKKWSKGKSRDKLNHTVMFDKVTHDKLLSEIPKLKLVTPSIICERLKINLSLARQAIKFLTTKGLVKPVCMPHHAQIIYTKVASAAA